MGDSEIEVKPSCSQSMQDKPKPIDGKIDLFLVPHTRMKELVSWPLAEVTRIIDIREMEPTLQAVYEAMWELKTHEYIENTYIMNRLKARLQKKRVYNEMVCNCHEDSKLLDVIHLVEKVYLAKTQTSRCKYSRQLQGAINSFLEEFVQHMKEEEAVFGPLLMENFDKEELEDMNVKVLEQHDLLREKVRSEKTLLKAVKRKRTDEIFDKDDLGFSFDDLRFKKSYCQEVNDHLKRKESEGEENQAKTDTNGSHVVSIHSPATLAGPSIHLPDEILLIIFSNLSPRDLLSASTVNKSWNRVAFSSVLWKALYPTQWTRGVWSFDYTPPEDADIPQLPASRSSSLSSSTESLDQTFSSTIDGNICATTTTTTLPSADPVRVFQGIVRDLLPKVGFYVSTLILSVSPKINNTQIRGMLMQLPNVRRVDLSYTKVSAEAMIGLDKASALRNLEELDLSGCRHVGDLFLENLSRCYSQQNVLNGVGVKSHLSKLILSGCKSISPVGLQWLEVHKASLKELDLSGCYTIDGQSLTSFVDDCARLVPEMLSYCNEIEDGPYYDRANGCLNLNCSMRYCCQKCYDY